MTTAAVSRTPRQQGPAFPRRSCSLPRRSEPLLRACFSRAPTGICNRALIAVLYRGGRRISETLALIPNDVDSAQGTLTVLHGNGDRQRTVGMDPAAFALVERWLDRRQVLGLSGRRPVFCTLAGERLDPSYVRRLLPRLAARAGIEARSLAWSASCPRRRTRGRGEPGQRRPAAARPRVARHDRPLPAPHRTR